MKEALSYGSALWIYYDTFRIGLNYFKESEYLKWVVVME
jgi:hypothetical protein